MSLRRNYNAMDNQNRIYKERLTGNWFRRVNRDTISTFRAVREGATGSARARLLLFGRRVKERGGVLHPFFGERDAQSTHDYQFHRRSDI